MSASSPARLEGKPLPALQLPSTQGDVDLAERSTKYVILFVYPRTAAPGKPDPLGWQETPGARGCTAEGRSFREHEHALSELGARILGVSAQTLEQQREFAARESIPFPLLSDPTFLLAEALGLLTFELAGQRFYERLTLVDDGRIAKVFHPVPRPETHGADVLAWLRAYAKVPA